jgi:hypothetical protein
MLAAIKAKFDAVHKRWHNWINAFWVVFSALWMMLPAIQGVMSARTFLAFSAVVVASFIYGRLTHQEGILDD